MGILGLKLKVRGGGGIGPVGSISLVLKATWFGNFNLCLNQFG